MYPIYVVEFVFGFGVGMTVYGVILSVVGTLVMNHLERSGIDSLRKASRLLDEAKAVHESFRAEREKLLGDVWSVTRPAPSRGEKQ